MLTLATSKCLVLDLGGLCISNYNKDIMEHGVLKSCNSPAVNNLGKEAQVLDCVGRITVLCLPSLGHLRAVPVLRSPM